MNAEHTHSTPTTPIARNVSFSAQASARPCCTFRAIVIALFMCSALAFSACTARDVASPYAEQGQIKRNPARSQELHAAALRVIDHDPTEAKRLLKEALAEDLFNGLAHNNLGVLHLKADPPNLYEAANEFEWAAKLLPGQPDPRHNRALVLELAGQINEAYVSYESALEVAPQYMPTIQARASLAIRLGHDADALRPLLNEISVRGTTESWRQWAKKQLVQR